MNHHRLSDKQKLFFNVIKNNFSNCKHSEGKTVFRAINDDNRLSFFSVYFNNRRQKCSREFYLASPLSSMKIQPFHDIFLIFIVCSSVARITMGVVWKHLKLIIKSRGESPRQNFSITIIAFNKTLGVLRVENNI